MQATVAGGKSTLVFEVDPEVYARLIRANIIKQHGKPKINDSTKRVVLDSESSSMVESGVAVARYIIGLKYAIQRRGNTQDLIVDVTKLSSLKHQISPQTKLFNWNVINTELERMGVKTDANTKSLIIAGDKESISKLFKAIDQQIQRLTQSQQIDIEEVPQNYTGNIAASQVGSQLRGVEHPPKRKAKDGVDILSLQTDKSPSESDSSLEFILNTLCRAFQMKSKQAAALLTNNNQFLIHSIVKGVKGNYDPLNSWYKEVKQHLKHLIVLLELETEQLPQLGNIPKVLATLAAGLYSQNIDICKHSFDILNQMNEEFSRDKDMLSQAHDWVVEKDGGLELSLQAFKRHQELAGDLIHFVQNFSSIMNSSIVTVYRDELRKLFPQPEEYINVINDIFPFLVIHSSKEVRESGILDFWIDMCLEQGGLDGQNTAEEKIAAMTLMTEIWLSFTDYVDRKPDRVNFIQSVLKKSARDRLRGLRIGTVSLMFRLLDKFAEEKNSSAPAIYKSLIFSLIENPSDIQIRDHYFSNFAYLFEQQSSIPLSLLVEPLIKQISISENVTYFYKVFDFDFFTVLAKHPKLTPGNAVALADLMGKIYLNESVLAQAASVPLMLLCSRFNLDEAMQEFITKFETMCLASLMNLEKNGEEIQKQHQKLLQEQEAARLAALGKKPLPLPSPPEFEHKHGKPTKRMTKEEIAKQQKEKEQEANRRLKKSLMVQILLKLQNLKHEELNEQLRELLLSSNRRFCKYLYGYYNKGIMTLLRYWGDADILMTEYMRIHDEQEEAERRDQESRENRAKQEKDRERRQETLRKQNDEMMRLRQSLDNGVNLTDEEERRLMIWEESCGELVPQSQDGVRDSMALMLYQGTTNNRLAQITMRNQKAQAQIDKIARSKIELDEQKRLDEERKRLVSVRRKQKLKEVLDKRKLELGIAPKSFEGDEEKIKEKLIYKDGEVLDTNEGAEKLRRAMSKMMAQEIKLLNLDEEEDRDREAMLLVMKKYSKLWKNLYYKYSNSGFSSKNVKTFDQLNERSQTISLGELTKLLKDHNTFPNLINKDELQTLFRQVNMKLFGRLDLQAMDYQAFQALLMQLAFFCFSRDPINLSHLPIAQTIQTGLIKQFEEATRSRGQSTVLYEDPDAPGIGVDVKLIKALNEKLAQDPQYPIPEGYVKQLEKTPIFNYIIPQNVRSQIKESKAIAYEILDQILADKLGIHILEPIVRFEERYKVKPQIKMVTGRNDQGTTQQAEALSYMNKVEKKVKPIENSLNPYTSLNALEKLKLQQEVKPELNITLKLEVAKVPIKERAFVQDVAEVFEEILQASEKGLKKLPPRLNRAPGQVKNEAKQKREDENRKEKEFEINREDVRKKRDQQLKEELVKIKEIKQREEEEKKIRDKLEKKQKAETARKAEEAIKKRLDDIKSLGGYEAVQKKVEEEKKKKQEEEEKKRMEAMKIDPEKIKSERKLFMKKQKEQLKESFQTMVKQREDLAAKQEALAAKEKEVQSKIKQSMDSYYKESAQDRGKETRERREINEFMQQEEVQAIFDQFDVSLRHMFRFYASQDKKEVGFNLERSMNSMNMRELIRFAYQQLIIPTLLQPEDIVQVFRQLIRERQDDVTSTYILTKSEDNYLVDKNFAQILDYENFKKALVRVAILAASGQSQAGGINAVLERETSIKRKGRKQGTKKEFSINKDAEAKEEAFLGKVEVGDQAQLPPSQSQRSRSTLKKNPIQGSGTADKANSGTIEGTGHKRDLTILTASLRHSKDVKLLQALDQKEQQESKFLQVASKIDKDRKVRKEFNVSAIQPRTIEALLRFLELEPDEKPKSLDVKLNQHRIEIQGQKPTRIRRTLKPSKLEDYIQEHPGMEDYDGDMGGEDMDGFARGEGGESGFRPTHQTEDGEVIRQQDTLGDEN